MSNQIHQILHMNGGTGELSYANNSNHQVATLSREASVLVRSVFDFCNTDLSEDVKVVTVADLGCSSGPTALTAVTKIINNIYQSCSKWGRSVPEFCVFLNDLPGNDFNTLFEYIPAFQDRLKQENGPESPQCFIAGVPGSFHGRLFPSNSLHFLHSSFSLHWLSQVPPELSNKSIVNKGKIYISKTSPADVMEAYKAQFERDFTAFLKARSEEVITGGRMVLLFSGRTVPDPSPDSSCLLWEYLAQAFQLLVNEGLVEEERLDSYNAPYYEAYVEEVKGEIEKEGSFGIEHLGISKITWEDINRGVKCDRETTARNMAKSIRASNESMFRNHFGAHILDALFDKFCKITEADTKVVDHYTIVLSLIRKP